MGRDAVDQFFEEFKERFRQLVRETVAEELEPIRELLVRPASETAPDMPELVDAPEVARLMGEDLSTPRKRRAAVQKVYNLARQNLIPSVRLSPRRVRFDPEAVKRCIAGGGTARPYVVPLPGAAHGRLAPPAGVDYPSRPHSTERR